MEVHIPAVPHRGETIHQESSERLCTEEGFVGGGITPETAEQLRPEGEVDMAVDEPGRNRMTGQIDNLRPFRLAHSCSNLSDGIS